MSYIKPSHLVFAFISFLFVAGAGFYALLNRNPDRTEWVKTIGVVQYKTYGRVGTRMFSYRKGDEVIPKARGGKGLTGGAQGDIYEILYNPKVPTEIFVFENRPLFMHGEEIGEAIGEITGNTSIYVEDNFDVARAEFSYYVNGKKYLRAQELRAPRDSSLHLEKGQHFTVRYWLQNPQRSILDFEDRR